MSAIIFIVIFYLVPLYFAFLAARKSVSHPEGDLYGLDVDNAMYIIVFCPVLNIPTAINYFNGKWRSKEFRKKRKTIFHTDKYTKTTSNLK